MDEENHCQRNRLVPKLIEENQENVIIQNKRRKSHTTRVDSAASRSNKMKIENCEVDS